MENVHLEQNRTVYFVACTCRTSKLKLKRLIFFEQLEAAKDPLAFFKSSSSPKNNLTIYKVLSVRIKTNAKNNVIERC